MNVFFSKVKYKGKYVIDPPVGLHCIYCDEVIKSKDTGKIINTFQAIHGECIIRMVVGSVEHQKRICPCYGGCETEREGLTKRQSALRAVKFYMKNKNE